MQVEKMSYEDLQWEILNNDEMHSHVNEGRFLSGLYTHLELVEIVKNYVFSANEALTTEYQTA